MDEEKGHRPELSFGSVDFKVNDCFRSLNKDGLSEMTPRSPQVPSFIFVLDVSAAARASGLLGAELRALRSTLDSIYEWLEAEAGDKEGERPASAQGRDESDGAQERNQDDLSVDRSGASLHSSIYSAQATFGNASPPSSTRSSATDQFSTTTNGLFHKPTAAAPPTSSDTDTHGPIRVGIVTFDSHVQFYSVRDNSPDPLSKRESAWSITVYTTCLMCSVVYLLCVVQLLFRSVHSGR